MDEQLEFLCLIAERLESARIPYMLTRSTAMMFYGVPRMTRDVDFVVELSPVSPARIVELFSSDCYIDLVSVEEAIQLEGMFNIIHYKWAMKADFVVRKNTPYRIEEFERRRTVDFEGRTLTVVAVEDLVLSKLVWAKDSQSELQRRDVQELVRAEKRLDWEYLNARADTLGVADTLRRLRDNE